MTMVAVDACSSSNSSAGFVFLLLVLVVVFHVVLVIIIFSILVNLLQDKNSHPKQRITELKRRLTAAQVARLETTNTSKEPKLLNGILKEHIIPCMDDGWGVEEGGVYNKFVIPALSPENGLVFERHSVPFTKEFIASLVENGKLSTLKQVYKMDTGILHTGFERLYSFAEYSSFYGKLWLQELNELDKFPTYTYTSTDLYCCAAERGHIRVLEWLRDQQFNLQPRYIAETAAWKGQLEVLKWLIEEGYTLEGASFGAAQGGQLGVLEWLLANGYELDTNNLDHAAQGGHLEIVQWLRNNGCPWSHLTCAHAAESGNFELLQWLRDNGCPWNETACYYAALAGNLEMLQWLRAKGCPWNGVACLRKARSEGFLEVEHWIRTNMS